MKFDIDVFRFDSKYDYNSYYQTLEVDIDENLSLKELLVEISKKIDNLSYDKHLFGFKINDIVVFNNIKIIDLKMRFGRRLILSPISSKYAKKDLLIDKEAIFELYKPLLDKFDFLSEESKLEFKKYILINLISPLEFDDYIGDGFCLYIKSMMIHYKDNVDELLDSISACENGVLNSLSVKYMIYPPDNSIDDDIEGLQKMLLERKKLDYGYQKLIKEIKSSYKKLER